MSKIHHPLRDAEFCFYQHIGGVEAETDRMFIGFFTDYQRYPMYFQGSSLEECRDRAVAFQDSESDKHERHYRTRIEALRKARKAKKK